MMFYGVGLEWAGNEDDIRIPKLHGKLASSVDVESG